MGFDPSGHFLYVGDYDEPKITAFQIHSSGALTQVPGSPFTNRDTPIFGLVTDLSGRFLYVRANTSITGYTIDQNSGALATLPGSPFFFVPRDPQPLGLVAVK
ncbi:MAG: hypothetical protein DMG62_03885 [Acidobacteria bacterium]|nr:MAG: hypothetical protein DMG63_11015 [Acidobacteriota bacterium]PYY24158.1 MAG: hypothetical protein DMG62_03885 [Acidobacteriota bacterium]